VRSESAIGQILECPKCQSMVQIVPPPGWTPPAPPASATSGESIASAPPPLSKIAADSAAVALDADVASAGSAASRRLWLVSGAAVVIAIVVVCGVWLSLHRDQDSPLPLGDTHKPPLPLGEGQGVRAETAQVPAPPQEIPTKQSSDRRPEGLPKTDSPPRQVAKRQPTAPPKATRPPDLVQPVVKENGPTTAPSADKKSPPKANPPVEKPVATKSTGPDSDSPDLRRLPPTPVDVAARMADPVRGLQLNDMRFARALDLLADISTLPITLDLDALRQSRGSPRDRVSLKLEDATVEEAIGAIVSQQGLAAIVDNGQVIITTSAAFRETPKTVPYTVSDLTGGDKTATAELGRLIQSFVASESWEAAGGHGTIRLSGDGLAVSQTGAVHAQVLVFCEKLRNARHLPLRSREPAVRFTLTTLTGQAKKLLDHPVSVHFHDPLALRRILPLLATAAGGDILVDRAALAAAETSDGVETTLTVAEKPLAAALAELLEPLGLTYRVTGPTTIQVTTKDAAEERMELEFHPVAARLPAGEDRTPAAAKLTKRLKTEISPASWTDSGGPGEVYFDAPSQCLIVLQSQRVQVAVERFLANP
jgi:hypothetical protein